jgi:hypothetical protein
VALPLPEPEGQLASPRLERSASLPDFDRESAANEAARAFTATVLVQAQENARAAMQALERGRRLLVIVHLLVFAVGLGAGVAAVVRGFLSDDAGEALATVGIAGLSAASFFALFLTRPLQSLERNAIYAQWLAAAVNSYWTRLAYLQNLENVDADIEGITKDLVADLDRLARRHAVATGPVTRPASREGTSGTAA